MRCTDVCRRRHRGPLHARQAREQRAAPGPRGPFHYYARVCDQGHFVRFQAQLPRSFLRRHRSPIGPPAPRPPRRPVGGLGSGRPGEIPSRRAWPATPSRSLATAGNKTGQPSPKATEVDADSITVYVGGRGWVLVRTDCSSDADLRVAELASPVSHDPIAVKIIFAAFGNASARDSRRDLRRTASSFQICVKLPWPDVPSAIKGISEHEPDMIRNIHLCGRRSRSTYTPCILRERRCHSAICGQYGSASNSLVDLS
jgi:hypothetical protein